MPIFFLLIISGIHPLIAQEKVKGSIEVDNETRKFRLYLPTDYSVENPMPIVFNLHGLTSDPNQQQLYTRMNEVAEENGFIVCYPKGKNRAWNVNFPFPSSKEDDVKFISTLIDSLSQDYAIDLNRVYACGFSNGGYMSYKLACELSDKIVAVAAVSGTFVPKQELDCQPNRAVPILHIHGTADPIVRYKGSPVAISAEKTVEFWRTQNGCSEDPEITAIDNKVKFDFSRATRYDFADCSENAAVSFIRVKNGGHTWPGAKIITGVTNKDFNASAVIWDFFEQFTLEETQFALNKPSLPAKVVVSPTQLKLSPNPTFGNILLEMQLEKAMPLARSLYTMQGQQLLKTEIIEAPKGNLQWAYDLSSLPGGMYLLRVQVGTTSFSKKVILKK